jgi:hypothetical protein
MSGGGKTKDIIFSSLFPLSSDESMRKQFPIGGFSRESRLIADIANRRLFAPSYWAIPTYVRTAVATNRAVVSDPASFPKNERRAITDACVLIPSVHLSCLSHNAQGSCTYYFIFMVLDSFTHSSQQKTSGLEVSCDWL